MTPIRARYPGTDEIVVIVDVIEKISSQRLSGDIYVDGKTMAVIVRNFRSHSRFETVELHHLSPIHEEWSDKCGTIAEGETA